MDINIILLAVSSVAAKPLLVPLRVRIISLAVVGNMTNMYTRNHTNLTWSDSLHVPFRVNKTTLPQRLLDQNKSATVLSNLSGAEYSLRALPVPPTQQAW